jgi:hypothetical protein
MKKIISTFLVCLLFISCFAQPKVKEGPDLGNEPDDHMNRVIQGENGAFYAYRIRTKGKGTAYLIEKFDEASFKSAFTKEVEIPVEKTKVMDVEFIGGKIYIFYRTYDKDAMTMTVFFKTVSPDGTVSASPTTLLSRKTDHYEFIDFDFSINENKSKVAVKTTYKANKEDTYKTDFILFNAGTQKTEWTKTVNKHLKRTNPWFSWNRTKETTGFLGFLLDVNDDIYYAFNDKLKQEDKKDSRYNMGVEILKAASQTPISVKIDLNPEYLVYDVQFSINKQKNVLIAGFFKDVLERAGRDLVDVGVFNYRINSNSGAIEGKAIKIFDNKILTALESNQKKARGMNYKVDYILPSGDDFYLVGEQYTVNIIQKQQSAFSTVSNIVAVSSGANPFYVGHIFTYEYMDVIVAKINSKGEFEWINNSPLRNGVTLSDNPHVFKQYVAVTSSKGLYLLYNEHAKNSERLAQADFKPSDLKTCNYIHGSNFVYSKITPDGNMKHDIVFKNETYCFSPIQERNIQFLPPEDAEIYIPGKTDEIFIYTEDQGKGRFCKLTLE